MRRLSLLALLWALIFPSGGPAHAQEVMYLSDVVPANIINGWGPIELDRSNGEDAPGDGQVITLRGEQFAKGLGVHAPSELYYQLNRSCAAFSARIGIDDEVESGSVVFQVFVGDDLRYDSGLVTRDTPALTVNVTLAGARDLWLIVATGGDNNYFDHADWADAQLTGCEPVQVAPAAPPAPLGNVAATPEPPRPAPAFPPAIPPAVGPQVVIPPMPAPVSGLTASPSGQAMPVGNLPGWRQVFADDFLTPAAVGAFDTVYRDRWESYPDGWANTAGYEAKARRYSSRVVSVANGMLNINLHSENLATSQLARNGGSGGPGMYALTAALQPKVGGAVYNQTYGKYTIRFRVDPGLDGYYAAWLLWPQSEAWPRDGEIDFPEGGLTGEMCAFMHHQGGTRAGDQDKFCSGVAFPTGWHTASTEWEPDRVTFILDGQVVGVSTSRIPNTPMRYVLQTEACWGSCPAPTMSGNIQVDWMVIYARG